MKPNFALSLSFEGIALLHRAAGGWRRVGKVALDAPDLTEQLAALRAKAQVLEPGGLRCKVIIPNDQVRYLTLDTGAVGGDARTEAVRAALVGATPYRLDELVFDISVDGAQTHVAAVARETLAEAEAFAVEHRLHPISFVAAPGDALFLGEPFFGASAHATSLSDGTEVEPDGIAVVVTGDVVMPERAPKSPAPTKPAPPPETSAGKIEPKPGAVTAPPLATAPGPGTDTAAPERNADTAPVAGFSSRRGKPDTVPPPDLGGASRDTTSTAPRRGLQIVPDAPDEPATPAPRITIAPPASAQAPRPVVVPAPVAAPTLDIPEFTPVGKPPVSAKSSMPQMVAGFLSRRKAAKDKDSKKRIAAANTGSVARVTPITSPPSPRIHDLPPGDETARMTLFGARQTIPTRGKPRHMGLILTAGLLLFLAAVAAWATIFLDDGLASLFRDRGDATAVAIAPQPAAPEPVARPASLPTLTLPAPEVVPLMAQPRDVGVTTPDAPSPQPGLSDTDTAVLDALGEPDDAMPDEATEPPQAALEDAALYAATGIWQTPPDVPDTPAIIGLDDLYVASIDRTDLSQDALALPPASGLDTDQALASRSSPAAADTRFVLDDRGLVTPTAAGTVSPEGVTVYLGRPAKVPPPMPARLDTGTEAEIDAVRDRLAGLRPRLRPGDLVERSERAQLGGLSREELGGVRPKLRPDNAKTEAEADETPTDLAIASSRAPKARPKDFAATVQAATQRQETQQAAVQQASAPAGRNDEAEADGEPDAAPTTVAPKIPSTASVARQATLENAINLSKVNLIGVYGTPSNRRALVRLPGGRYKKVKVGDSVDGGRVVAIGDSELRYQKGGRNMTLKIPSG